MGCFAQTISHIVIVEEYQRAKEILQEDHGEYFSTFLGKGHKDETKFLQKREPFDTVSTSGIRLCCTTLIACSHCKEYIMQGREFFHIKGNTVFWPS